jgi:hypothetical protein
MSGSVATVRCEEAQIKTTKSKLRVSYISHRDGLYPKICMNEVPRDVAITLSTCCLVGVELITSRCRKDLG